MSLITILRKWLRVLDTGFVSHSISVAPKKLQIADLRALDGLSNATRRDLGLAERLSPQLPRADHDRVRW
jgi:hypothetical protein